MKQMGNYAIGDYALILLGTVSAESINVIAIRPGLIRVIIGHGQHYHGTSIIFLQHDKLG